MSEEVEFDYEKAIKLILLLQVVIVFFLFVIVLYTFNTNAVMEGVYLTC